MLVEAEAFGEAVTMEVRQSGPSAPMQQALQDALAEIVQLDRLTDAYQETPLGVSHLNGAAGSGPTAVDPRLVTVLRRAVRYCVWSRGAHGPLGGTLYGLWGLHYPVGGFPSPSIVGEERAKAACSRLQVDTSNDTATLSANSRVELWGFAQGFAVDRAVEILKEGGITNAWVEIGFVTRAFGPGPEGHGWPIAIGPDGSSEPERILLQDRAVSLASVENHPLEIGGETFAPYIDQRTGKPVDGKVAVAVVSELAVDAEALASTLFILPNREGEFRLGELRPKPSVIWFLGRPGHKPLVTELNWSKLPDW